MGISRHFELQDLTSVVTDDEKAVQNTKRERWDGEEIHRRNGFAMVHFKSVVSQRYANRINWLSETG
jgi:hypothetical protein